MLISIFSYLLGVEVKPNKSQMINPMPVTLTGMVIESTHCNYKAKFPMVVTLPSVGITLLLQPKIKVLVAVLIKQLFEL